MIPAVANGTKIVLMHKWHPEKALELMEREHVATMSGVPSMTWQLLESPDFEKRNLRSLEGLSYGGAAAFPDSPARSRHSFPASSRARAMGPPKRHRSRPRTAPKTILRDRIPWDRRYLAAICGSSTPTATCSRSALSASSKSTAATSSKVTGIIRKRHPKPFGTAGTVPATSFAWTTKASCICLIGQKIC